jgi:hypothetical protein
VLDARVAADRAGSGLSLQSDAVTPWGSVSLVSTSGSVLDNASDTAVNVYANELKLSAGISGAGALGASSDAFEAEVARFSASVGTGGLFLSEATALTLGQSAALTVKRVLRRTMSPAQALWSSAPPQAALPH